ncbi:MAG: hypothetical protein LBU60_06080 [Clostridiales bacterium]|nr:hypothetical protein [Clostridiales bacterium]
MKKNILTIKSVAAVLAMLLLAALFVVACTKLTKHNAPTSVSITGLPNNGKIGTGPNGVTVSVAYTTDNENGVEIEWVMVDNEIENPAFPAENKITGDTFVVKSDVEKTATVAVRVRVEASDDKTGPSDWTTYARTVEFVEEGGAVDAGLWGKSEMADWMNSTSYSYGNNFRTSLVTILPDSSFINLHTIQVQEETPDTMFFSVENELGNDQFMTFGLMFGAPKGNTNVWNAQVIIQFAKDNQGDVYFRVSQDGLNNPADVPTMGTKLDKSADFFSIYLVANFAGEGSTVSGAVNGVYFDDVKMAGYTEEDMIENEDDYMSLDPKNFRALWLLDESLDIKQTNVDSVVITTLGFAVSEGQDSQFINLQQWLTDNDYGNNSKFTFDFAMRPDSAFRNLNTAMADVNLNTVEIKVQNSLQVDDMMTFVLTLNDVSGENSTSEAYLQLARTSAGTAMLLTNARESTPAKIVEIGAKFEGNPASFDISFVASFGASSTIGASVNGESLEDVATTTPTNGDPVSLRSLWLLDKADNKVDTTSYTTVDRVYVDTMRLAFVPVQESAR